MEDDTTRGSPPFNLAGINDEKHYSAYIPDTHKQFSGVLLRINGPFLFRRVNIRQMVVGSLNAFLVLFCIHSVCQ